MIYTTTRREVRSTATWARLMISCRNLGWRLASVLSLVAMGFDIVFSNRVPSLATGSIISPPPTVAATWLVLTSPRRCPPSAHSPLPEYARWPRTVVTRSSPREFGVRVFPMFAWTMPRLSGNEQYFSLPTNERKPIFNKQKIGCSDDMLYRTLETYPSDVLAKQMLETKICISK